MIQKILLLVYSLGFTLPAFGYESAGIGIAIGRNRQNLVVEQVISNTSAASCKAIHVGDRILFIAPEGKKAISTHNLTIEQAVSLIRGKEGTSVYLTLFHAGEVAAQSYSIKLVRGKLRVLSEWGDGLTLAIGSKAPNIEMLNLKSNKHERLSDYAGKLVVLNFWSTWCNACQDDLVEFQRYPTKHPEWKKEVTVIAASTDKTKYTVRQHLRARGWAIAGNVWVEQDAIKAFHVNQLPTTYIIDARGNIVAADVHNIPAAVARLLK